MGQKAWQMGNKLPRYPNNYHAQVQLKEVENQLPLAFNLL